MNIAHIIWELETGGAETMLVDIVNEQVKTENVSLVVVNYSVNKALLKKVDSGCHLRLIKRKRGSKSIIPWIKLNAFLFYFKPDIIHFHLEGLRKMVIHPAPKVFTIHNMVTTGVEFHRFKALYAISESVRIRTKEQGYESTLILNGIHPDKIQNAVSINHNTSNIYRFVCVGRLYVPYKGQDILIKALASLRERGYSNFHLDLIGDGESKILLESMITELGLNDLVSFLGHKDREYIYSHLKDYDLFILPSRSEGFGIAVAEAMCAKIPVLISNLKGPMEVIGNGKYGLFFESENSENLAEQLLLFLKNGEDMNKIENAYQYAVLNFNIKNVSAKYIEEYKRIL